MYRFNQGFTSSIEVSYSMLCLFIFYILYDWLENIVSITLWVSDILKFYLLNFK